MITSNNTTSINPNSTIHSHIYDKMLEDEHYSPREDPPSI